MDDSARRGFFMDHRESLRRFVRRLTPRDDEAEDMLQDVALIVLTHKTGPTDSESYFGWCCGVARHVAAHRRRTHARQSVSRDGLHSGGVEAALAPTMGEDLERVTIARAELSALLDGLEPTARALLHDRFVLEETAAEIGARLNMTAASVRMRIARLLSELRPNAATAAVTPLPT